jgi:FkbM family methyltransferase
MYFGVYEVAVVRLFRRLLTPGETAIDVGGNIGYMALHMARLVGNAGRVHAFEPVPATADRFEQNLILNGFEAIVKLHRSAVGAAVGEADIHTFAERGASRHVLSSMKPLHGKHEKTPARVVSLDDEVDGPVRLIKIDIEGAEVDALRGARQTIARYRPHIIVENNPGALAAFGHSFADILKIVWETAPGGYEAVLFERAWPRDRIVPDGAAHVPVGNVWLRPLDKHPS